MKNVNKYNPFLICNKNNYLKKSRNIYEETMKLYTGYVSHVFDIDNTITIISRLPYNDSPFSIFYIVLKGIHIPNINGKTYDEKASAISMKKYLSDLILHKYIYFKNVNIIKENILSADVYYENIYINELLLKEMYAVKNDKINSNFPDSWIKYKIIGE
jgi:hypothetical protein